MCGDEWLDGIAGSKFQAEGAACVKTLCPSVYLRIQKI